MKTLLDTKYIKITMDLKSWALPLMYDWRHNGTTRPCYISILCLHFEIGIDPPFSWHGSWANTNEK